MKTQKPDIYLSPDGNDAWSGTLSTPRPDGSDGPVATLAAARDRIRRLKNDEMHDYRVSIRGGVYRLGEPVIFGLEDGGAGDESRHIVTYEAYPGEKPVFSGGVPVTDWKKLDNVPDSLPTGARGHVWVADLPKGLGCIKSLFDGDQLLPRAATEKYWCDGPDPQAREADKKTDPKRIIWYPEDTMRSWPNIDDVEIKVRTVNWTVNLLSLQEVNEESRYAITKLPATYPMDQRLPFRHKVHGGRFFRVENVLEALDSPGEWVVDTSAGKIYLWPFGDAPGESIVAPRVTELIRVEGTVDKNGPVDTPVVGIIFRGLTFMHGDRDVWVEGDAGIQHDWEMVDKANGLVRFRGAEQCAVEDCRFTGTGGTAVRLDLHCRHCRVVGNEITNAGQGGVMLIGYGPGTKDVNQYNSVINNHIHDCGLILEHSHGIVMCQSGYNRIAHNYIHHMPRKAICLTGVRVQYFQKRDQDTRECGRTIRWHEVGGASEWSEILPFLHTRKNLVEYNEVERCLQKLGDGSAVNVSGAGLGNVLRRNYIHDIYGADGEWICACVRTDDWQRETLITENVIAHSSTAALEHKCENAFINNIIYDVAPEFYLRFGRRWGPFLASEFSGNIFINPRGTAVIYFPFKDIREMSTCAIDRNVYFNIETGEDGSPGDDLNELARYGHDVHSIYSDPLLVDPANGDYRLKDDSPARLIGISSFDIRSAGLLHKQDNA
jgi:hypothetical protein